MFRGSTSPAVALPLGGFGAGHVALGADGSLRQWQLGGVGNHLAALPASLFGLRVASVEASIDECRLLRSPCPPPEHPAPGVTDHVVAPPPAGSWPLVTDTELSVAYPFGRVRYAEPALPVEVRLAAYTPFVPGDADASGLPLVAYRFELTSTAPCRLHGFLLATLVNAVGWDWVTPDAAGPGGNVNRVVRDGTATTIVMDNPSLPDDDPFLGEMALWTDAPAIALPRMVSAAAAMRAVEALRLAECVGSGDWSSAGLRRGLAEAVPHVRYPAGPSAPGHTWVGGLAAAWSLAPGETATVEIVHAWRFPNRQVDFDQYGVARGGGRSRLWVGNRYAERFGSVTRVLDHYAAHRDELHRLSAAWAEAVDTLPEPLSSVLTAQGAALRNPATFRTADGKTYGFEGVLGATTRNWSGDVGGSCPLNCTHVWNYAQALSRVFPELERGMRETELEVAQAAEGYLPHRIVLPLWLPQLHGRTVGGPAEPALDGMLGTVLKTYREARQGAGIAWLARMWPRLVRLMSYVERTWHRTGDGLLTGPQPVTYDIAFTNPNMFVGSLWLAALRAMQRMAEVLGEPGDGYRQRFEAASARYDDLLWNGEYWAQPDTGALYDFGSGCLSDQLVGQWWAHQLELGHLLPPERVRSALRAIVRHNTRTGFGGLDLGRRSFADRDDTGLVNCSWPRGGRPSTPTPYCDEVWTGTEYQVAAHCVMEGLTAEGMAVAEAVAHRYDGTRRNPYNHLECGDHYARAMSGWTLLDAMTGFRYDALSGLITVSPQAGGFPFVAGGGWGVIEAAGDVRITCVSGAIEVGAVRVGGGSPVAVGRVLGPGDTATVPVEELAAA